MAEINTTVIKTDGATNGLLGVESLLRQSAELLIRGPGKPQQAVVCLTE